MKTHKVRSIFVWTHIRKMPYSSPQTLQQYRDEQHFCRWQEPKPLSSVTIKALRTEGSGNLAYVYGQASWVNGRASDAVSVTNVRLIIVWRKEEDGRWRVAQELLNADPTAE